MALGRPSKKYKGKRQKIKDKVKIRAKVAESHRQARKASRKFAATGRVRKEVDPGVPNNHPFKAQILAEMEKQKLIAKEEAEAKRAACTKAAKARKAAKASKGASQ
ncbi:hypothetical protein KIPB_005731 [Kipferlia bialata]|uniref:Guanine nucleotide-binding protein-like 3 N-terminal domain-containing protein n=1 Tax=Kipferlia bialata TaxID=797122 RepID=A0A9K3CWH2_9EUKA|nr:hypothetical protein KIPB_005731 [Kipferlia bialata]|eukprot:g5731.t1